jgi:hypothetical protein
VWLLYIHLNIPPGTHYDAQYDFTMTDVKPAPLADAFGILSLLGGAAPAAALNAPAPQPYNIWGLQRVRPAHLPNQTQVAAGAVQGGKAQSLGSASTFSNEGRYHFDFSFGVPVKKITQLQFDSTNQAVAPKSVDQQNVFALVDLYPAPQDLARSNFSYIPYLVGGVAFAHQPLHKLLLAAGWGPAFGQFYAGCLWVKQAKPGTTNQYYFHPELSLGINISVRGFQALLKKNQ